MSEMRDGNAPRRAALLTLEPAAQAVEVEDVPARQLLRRVVRARPRRLDRLLRVIHRRRWLRGGFGRRSRVGRWRCFSRRWAELHVFAADDARLVGHGVHLFAGRVRVQRVHVARRLAEAAEVAHFEEERAQRDVDVAEDVEREAVEREDEAEEEEVGAELEEVCVSQRDQLAPVQARAEIGGPVARST